MAEQDSIGLYSAPLTAGGGRGGIARRLFSHYRSVLLPRDEAYMRTLFAERFPAGRFIDIDADPDWRRSLAGATSVVLLYPDPIGFGFRAVERAAREAMAAHGTLRALTGRRREFQLSRSMRFHLGLRRLLTRCLVVEAVLGGALLVATPFLVAVDRLSGRR